MQFQIQIITKVEWYFKKSVVTSDNSFVKQVFRHFAVVDWLNTAIFWGNEYHMFVCMYACMFLFLCMFVFMYAYCILGTSMKHCL